eukprot:TRINITY_DN4809_c0_g1_i15.p1 TRINITY_DN4809_c0_g1~~TRINITY_DN4809_c0_g1_i15.p1  ORF type:complete len:130 (+),score=32.04 TRINITY_DN4809_c0_g1_i15:141-530(+)
MRLLLQASSHFDDESEEKSRQANGEAARYIQGHPLEQPGSEAIPETQMPTRKRHKSANQVSREPLIEKLPIIPAKVNLQLVAKLNCVFLELMDLLKQKNYTAIFNKCSQWWDATADCGFPPLTVSTPSA